MKACTYPWTECALIKYGLLLSQTMPMFELSIITQQTARFTYVLIIRLAPAAIAEILVGQNHRTGK